MFEPQLVAARKAREIADVSLLEEQRQRNAFHNDPDVECMKLSVKRSEELRFFKMQHGTSIRQDRLTDGRDATS
jgi:hypothetical protein